ncbi:hypothetical protein LQ567_25890 [Niabella pedocola]|uniref:DUF4238 domain-containing protein n=1 Tax=Niabella pedocola TaxID=1752077 RepID=A0ABS8PZH8_9BACT|nr:hypothetical protein [Niabella pedocola]MCD2426244.1 hypothetical protein [Niabella pedocola]
MIKQINSFSGVNSVYKRKLFISNLTGLSDRSYGVSVKYYKGTAADPFKRIDYEATIRLAEHQQGWLMRLEKKDLFFNRHEPDTVSERFADLVSRSLYPVETVIDGWGTQVTGIVNHEAIIKRWHENRQELLDKYSGPVADDFITVVDQRIKSSAVIQRSMSYDLFWNLFFHPKYMAYTETYIQPVALYLSVIPYKAPVRFPGTQKIIPQITDYGSIMVQFVSEALEAPQELLPGHQKETPCYMQLTADFDLDKEHHFAMHTRALLEIYEKAGRYTTVPLQKIEFTMYQL